MWSFSCEGSALFSSFSLWCSDTRLGRPPTIPIGILQRREEVTAPFELTAHSGNDELYGLELDLHPHRPEQRLPLLPERAQLATSGKNDFLHEVDVGSGCRRLMGDASWILGGYGFFDRKESRYDDHFNQERWASRPCRGTGRAASTATSPATTPRAPNGAGTAVPVQLIGTKLTMAGRSSRP